jgi:hypothetical protein
VALTDGRLELDALQPGGVPRLLGERAEVLVDLLSRPFDLADDGGIAG